MVDLNSHYRCAFGDLWVNKVRVSFSQQLDLKNRNKTKQVNYTDSALMG